MRTATEDIKRSAEFLASRERGGCMRADSKRECVSANCERSELASMHFLRCSGFLGELRGARQQQSCIKRTGLAARKVYELARCRLFFCLALRLTESFVAEREKFENRNES